VKLPLILRRHAQKFTDHGDRERLGERFDEIDLAASELRRIFGDGVNQAADLVSGATSIPSRNLTPLMTFGNWL
jgi:hypothetical protein